MEIPHPEPGARANGRNGTRHLHSELAQLRGRLLDMGSLAEHLVRTSTEALQKHDPLSALGVLERDRELDVLEVEMDEECIRLLALQQPIARDLRLITTVMRISTHLERVGDHAVNIARTVEELREQPLGQFPHIGDMAGMAMGMLAEALDCFVREDALRAHGVHEQDRRMDSLQEILFREVLGCMLADPRRIGPCMLLVVVSRNLERIADLATNIAEDVVYLVEGEVVRRRMHPG